MTAAQLNLILAALANVGTPMTGTIILFGSATPPSGYLPCDGAAVSRVTFAALFAICGTSFGVGDGATTFNVPDLRSRLPMGAGAGPGLTVRAVGAKGGAESSVVAQANLAAFALPVTDPGHTHDVLVNQDAVQVPGVGVVAGVVAGAGLQAVANAAVSDTTGVTVASGGSSTPLPTLDPYSVVAYFVKT